MQLNDRLMGESAVGPVAQAGSSRRDRPASVSADPPVRRQLPLLRVRVVGDVTVVDLVNAELLNDHGATSEVRKQLHGLVRDGHVRLLLNLGGVRAISGEVLATLAGLYREVHRRQGSLGLFGLQPLFRDMLRICQLDQVLEIYADESDGIGRRG
jgi:anti-sigma B factor antagonist